MSKFSRYQEYRIFAVKFSRSPYFDKHLSESIFFLHHRYLEGLAFIPQHRTPGYARGGARGQNLVHIQKNRSFALKFSRRPYFDSHFLESIHICTIDTL